MSTETKPIGPNPCPRCGSISAGWDGLGQPIKWCCGLCRLPFIKLTRGLRSFVDDADHLRLLQFPWHVKIQKFGNHARKNPTLGDRFRYMHHFILGVTTQIDHRDNNGLNNQRSNLRQATSSQNNANSTKRAGCSSSYRGVTWNKSCQKWQAACVKDNKVIHIGYFREEYDAATAYNFGELYR